MSRDAPIFRPTICRATDYCPAARNVPTGMSSTPPKPGALEQPFELVGPARARERRVARDLASHDQVGKRLLEGLHASGSAGLHDRVDLLDLPLPDQVADCVVGKEDLDGRQASVAVDRRHERLRDDRLQRARDLHPDLLLLGGGEHVDQSVDGRGSVLGVEGGEDEVAGLGRRQRGPDRLEVAHLAHEDHVGVLAERAAQRLREARRVGPDLTLVDHAFLVAVEELDRVLDRDDVIGPGVVDLVDDRCECRRLTGAGRSRDEHEAARLLRELVELLREPEVFELLDLGGNETEGGAEALALEVDVDAEAGEAWDRIGEIELALDLELLLLLGREDPIQEPLGVVGREPGHVGQALEAPVDADSRLGAGRDVQVRGPARDDAFEQIVDRQVR